MKEQRVHLFVYGTLMPCGPLHGQIEQFVRGERPGVIAGILVDLGAFPALIDGLGYVRGVLLDMEPEALAATDRIEGYAPDWHRCFYRRVETVVHLDDGESVTAWTYKFGDQVSLANKPRLVVGEMNAIPLYAWRPR